MAKYIQSKFTFRIRKSKVLNVYYRRIQKHTNDPDWDYVGKKFGRQDYLKHELLKWIKHSIKWEFYLRNQISILMENYEQNKRLSDRDAMQTYTMQKRSDLLRNYIPKDWIIEEKNNHTGEVWEYPATELMDRHPPKFDF
jgi:hypothetical protein